MFDNNLGDFAGIARWDATERIRTSRCDNIVVSATRKDCVLCGELGATVTLATSTEKTKWGSATIELVLDGGSYEPEAEVEKTPTGYKIRIFLDGEHEARGVLSCLRAALEEVIS